VTRVLGIVLIVAGIACAVFGWTLRSELAACTRQGAAPEPGACPVLEWTMRAFPPASAAGEDGAANPAALADAMSRRAWSALALGVALAALGAALLLSTFRRPAPDHPAP